MKFVKSLMMITFTASRFHSSFVNCSDLMSQQDDKTDDFSVEFKL